MKPKALIQMLLLLALLSVGMVGTSSAGGAPAATAPATQPGADGAAVPGAASSPTPNQEMVSISFRDVPVEQIFIFISEKTGKPVIPQDSIRQKRITVVSSQQRPLAEAMQIIQEALRQNGIVMEESPRVINMKSLSDARQSTLQIVPETQKVSTLVNKAQVVQKIFELQHFDVGKMKDVILPMLPDFGHIVADPNTRRLIVTDTVEDLERIERLIGALDVPEADQTIKKIIVVKKGDAADIVATVRVLIASSLGSRAQDILAGGAGRGGPGGGGAMMPPGSNGMPPGAGGMAFGGPGGGGPMPGPGGGGGAQSSAGGSNAVFVEENKAPVVLMADVSRNWIIAVASARIMVLIDEWVAKLDVPVAPGEAQFDVLEIQHADMDDVTRQIAQTIEALPGGEGRQAVRIVPFAQSRKILVTGSRRGRDMVRDLLAQLDKEAGNQTMRVFELRYADAEEVAQDIENLYGGNKEEEYNPFYYEPFYGRNNKQASQRIKVTADVRRNAIVVISDPAMLDQIDKLLKEQWDLPLSDKEAQPKIYTIKYVDPVKLKDMLDELFYKKKAGRSESPFYIDYLLESATSRNDQPVGRLYGQFRFQAMPDSNRLLVIAKSAANYAVMDNLIAQLDQPQDAGIPQMIELKHANAEDLAEQLNATLAEPGTLAEILRAKRELTATGPQSGLPASGRNPQTNANNPNANPQQQTQDNSNPNMMTFWWQRAPRRVDEKPTSNLIGKIRFVPVNRRNALLIVAPQAYMEPIRQLIEQLDRAGMQVLIHAVIASVQHSDQATLGMRLASDPSIFNDPRLMDSAIGGSGTANATKVLFGTPSLGTNTGSGSSVLSGNLNVNVLLQLLIRKYGLKMLFEPKLYTADNQEAEFFDGQDVPYESQSQSSPEGTSVTQSFNYTSVGTYLRIRPHITNENDVDLTVNLELSSIVEGQTVFGNFIFDRQETHTHVIMRDGETVMLSGIIQNTNSKDVRKIPILGDIPLLGRLFRSSDNEKNSQELIAFITPHVIRPNNEPAITSSYRQWIDTLRKEMNGGKPATTNPAEGGVPSTSKEVGP